MSISEKKQRISRSGFREAFKEHNPIAPGTARKLFSSTERMEMEKKLFGKKKVGGITSRERYKKLILKIGGSKYKISDIAKREIIDKKIKILKKIGKAAKYMDKKSKNSKKDFFGKRGYLTRAELRGKLRKASPFVRGFSGMMKKKERVRIEKEVLGRKYGHFIDKKDSSEALKELRKAKWKAKTRSEKRKIKRDIRLFKDLTGL